MAHPLDGPRAKLDRAAEHLDSLRPEYDEWFGTGLDIIETVEADERDRDGSVWLVSRCSRVLREPPARWGLIVGDAIQNTRAALDHLACRLVEGAGNVPDKRTAFPIWDDDPYVNPDDRRSFERSLRGMAQDSKDAIKELQPYQDPASPNSAKLVALAALSNLDKHQVILPALLVFDQEIPVATWSVTPRPDQVQIVVNRGAEIVPGVELARARTLSGRHEMGVTIGFDMKIAYSRAEPPIRLPELREIRAYVVGIVESFGPIFG